MASPIALYIIPNCGLKIDYDSSNSVRTDSNAFKYKIANIHNIPLVNESASKKVISGWMSPIHQVTLPSAVKQMSGIPSNAVMYSYLHPPSDLANAIEWKQYYDSYNREKHRVNHSAECIMGRVKCRCKDDMDNTNTWGIPAFALMGAYAYFDKDLNVVGINAISLLQTMYDLRFSGPFEVNENVKQEIRSLNRVHPLVLEVFHEVGFVESTWVKPQELFNFHKPIVSDKIECSNGGFIFYRDDGSSVIYVLEPSGYIDPTGKTSSLADVFQSEAVNKFVHRNLSVTTDFAHILPGDLERYRKSILYFLRNPSWRQRLNVTLKDENTLLHKACQSGCSAEEIHTILQDKKEVENLLYKDSNGWIPMHYACRFRPKDMDLITLLIEYCPSSIVVTDQFDRCALHIASESNASVEVFKILLEADKSGQSILQQTKLLGRLPIHICCKRDVHADIISCLLEADPGGETLNIKTRSGRLSLHIAIENGMSPDVVRIMLGLDVQSNYQRHISDSTNSIELSIKEQKSSSRETIQEKSIREQFDGLIPLHLACWNNRPAEIIELLLERDEDSSTIYKTVGQSSWLVSKRDLLDDEDNKRSIVPLPFSKSDDTDSSESDIERKNNYLNVCDKGSIVALHLAAHHGNEDVINCLLRKEKTKPKGIDFSTVQLLDSKGRCALHIACKYTLKPGIISQLLDADLTKRTILINDDRNCKAIHYACDHQKNAEPEILKLLIEAEDQLMTFQDNSNYKRMTHTRDDRKQSPLYLAVKCGVHSSILETLLSPEHFYLNGFDSRHIQLLANRSVANKAIQLSIIEKITERCYFSFLFVDLYAHVFGLLFFINASEKLINGNLSIMEPSLLIICMVEFILREVVQMKSQSSQYLADLWNWFQITSLVLMTLNINVLIKNIGNENPEYDPNIFIVSGAFLIAQFVFYLRTTFLPFASFVGGLLLIFNTLVPFFIVSGLLLLAFTYGFRMSGEHGETCPTMLDCYSFTLHGFFSGSDETSDLLDIMFGIVAIIVLLNVLIAIVSDAWDSAKERSINLYWKFRLEFLSEARFYAVLERKMYKAHKMKNIGDYFDAFSDIRFVDRTEWTQSPFDKVKTKKQYFNPSAYFPSSIAKQITEARSLQADLYWTALEDKKRGTKGLKKFTKNLVVILKWVVSCAFYYLLVIIGLVTAGWTWPKSLRRRVLAVGLSNKGDN